MAYDKSMSSFQGHMEKEGPLFHGCPEWFHRNSYCVWHMTKVWRYLPGAVLIAQWMRPCHCPGTSNITQELDSIAERVAVHLVGSTTPEEGEVKRVRQSALARVKEEGDYSVDERLTALNSVLYDQLGYRGAGETYYELHNSLIDQVSISKCGMFVIES